jgi:hypothetical protein
VGPKCSAASSIPVDVMHGDMAHLRPFVGPAAVRRSAGMYSPRIDTRRDRLCSRARRTRFEDLPNRAEQSDADALLEHDMPSNGHRSLGVPDRHPAIRVQHRQLRSDPEQPAVSGLVWGGYVNTWMLPARIGLKGRRTTVGLASSRNVSSSAMKKSSQLFSSSGA